MKQKYCLLSRVACLVFTLFSPASSAFHDGPEAAHLKFNYPEAITPTMTRHSEFRPHKGLYVYNGKKEGESVSNVEFGSEEFR